MTLASQTLLGRYRLQQEIGAGGMARVYLADDLKHRRHVAVKVLLPELAQTIAHERFLREIEIAAQLLHPHILGLIDSGEVDGSLFYVMPYVDGESVRHWLARDAPLPVRDVVRVLRDVLGALAFAHGRGIVHRDIKPENILLLADASREASPAHALVTDFGIAKALEAARDEPRPGLTTFGTSLGTPTYMSPEQAAGDHDVDPRADLYSLGVVAYELITGEPPFMAPTARQLMAAHITRAPEPVSRRRAPLPSGLEQVVMRSLAKQPADRYQTADDMIRELDALGTVDTHVTITRRRDVVERTFRLSEEVCRKLDRSTLDPRIIGDVVRYLDNENESDVLVCFLHGTGLDQTQSERFLRELPYRAIAPTLFGFEPGRRHRIPLALDDHLTITRELVREVRQQGGGTRCILVGLSSGADVALRLAARPTTASDELQGILALGCNVSLETCFATRIFANLGGDAPEEVLGALQQLSLTTRTLDDWLNVHGYMVDAIRKCRYDVSAIRQFARDIAQPFIETEHRPPAESPFVQWYRVATAKVARVRCVFEDEPSCNVPVGAIRLSHVDAGVLGPQHRGDGILTEPGTSHLDLFRPEVVYRHLAEVLASDTGA